ncbi:MAG TPA: FeoA domain-containing protein [Candidatus Gallimonas intestinavium]|uniref:FeoA domain-containing protein n=1 Tax=Candidatus Gallimonas intestinavium TaxID=2838603 RepID=A0A9D2G5A1_9FIRM|nr:FeoA domain-containing protein [Candidatus Gallimonas intestinavium]
MQLCEAQKEHDYTVKAIHLPFETERRLQALGMTDNTPIRVVNRKGKGILVVRLRGTRFAFGYNITKNIEVEEVPDEQQQ